MNTVQMLNEGFNRRYLKEAEEEIKNQEETDEIEVGDLFLNGDETFKLLDIAMDEDGEVIVNAENEETGEEEEIEYAPVDLDDEEDEIIEEGIFGFGKKSPEQLKNERENALKQAFRSMKKTPEIYYSAPRKSFIINMSDLYGIDSYDDNVTTNVVRTAAKSVSADMKKLKGSCNLNTDKNGNFIFTCQFKESVNRPKINRKKLKESIKRVLRKMNEAQMSPEDRRDTDILRGIYNKSSARKNARLTQEEKDTLNKYGLYRDDWGNINKALSKDYSYSDPEIVKTDEYQNDYNNKRFLSNDKINLADRARKMDSRGRGYKSEHSWIHHDPSREFKRNGRYVRLKGKGLLDYERATQNDKMQANYNDMSRALKDRKYNQGELDSIDRNYDEKRKKLQAQIDELENSRAWEKEYHSGELNSANAKINKLLKKESLKRRKGSKQYK